jgi:putative endonuclease
VNKRKRGAWGEEKAVEFLTKKGYIIVERNFTSSFGEIDVIARDHDVIVFIEVKVFGTYSPEDLERSVGKRKQRRIAETAQAFIVGRPEFQDSRLRCDVIAVRAEKDDIVHFENAF